MQILLPTSPVRGLRDEAQGASLQKSAQAAHTMGTVGNTHFAGSMGTGKSGEPRFQGI